MKTLAWLLFTRVFTLSSLSQTVETRWRVEGGLTVSMFQQQVKTEIGGARGDRLVNEAQFGIAASGTYRLLEFAAAGIFIREDFGNREAANFDGFDPQGRTRVKNAIGGSYSEFWLGPHVRFIWKQISLEVGYVIIGVRADNGRKDLPSTTGDVESTLKSSASVAWLVAIGGALPLWEDLDLVMKIDCRIRYYDERGSDPLTGNIVHGTQSLAPYLGVAWRL